MWYVILVIIAVLLIIYLWPVFVGIAVIFAAWEIYVFAYFRSKNFLAIKNSITTYVQDCNELNEHIEELKSVDLGVNQPSRGTATHYDNSKFKYKRKGLEELKYAPNVFNCSKAVCDGAKRDPFGYFCKYFKVKADEPTLEKFETALNNFEAVEEGKTALQNQKQEIYANFGSGIPRLIKKFCGPRLEKELGFEEIDLSDLYFPVFRFSYTSPGGNKSDGWDIVMDTQQLEAFVQYLSDKVKFAKSVAGQRALMTSALREKIKQRDDYTCQNCGLSTTREPNLLLEIDHIIPVSKGGMTAEDNLQTLCWRCNRKKGARLTVPVS